ncbi:MAG TPA: hypothetical protein PK823_00445 [Novosphingobium sp.]|nr:hypothetical protein [Novosphingobium sp.]
MSKIVVELDAYVLPDDHAIFKISPGKTYRFYQEVRRTNVVFLDIRGLDNLAGDPVNWADDDVLKTIADDRWEREVISRERGNEPKGSEGVTKTDKTRLGFLKALLGEAKKGDLVVVPADGYTKDVLIGELLDEPWHTVSVDAEDGEEGTFTYVGRRVRWRAAQPKRLFSSQLIDALHVQTAMFQLGRSLSEEIYRLAYRNFVHKNNYVSEFYTSKVHFTSEDSAVLSAWLNGFEVLRNRIESNNSGSLPGSFAQMGLAKMPDNAAADLRAPRKIGLP